MRILILLMVAANAHAAVEVNQAKFQERLRERAELAGYGRAQPASWGIDGGDPYAARIDARLAERQEMREQLDREERADRQREVNRLHREYEALEKRLLKLEASE